MSHAPKDQTKAIYSNYRAALRAQPHTVSSRAGERKQKALQITADRYHVPISEVKEIVRNLEAENGVSHEHDSGYLKKLQIEAEADLAAERFMAAQLEATGDPNHAPICTTCGTSAEEDIVRIRLNEVNVIATDDREFTLQCFKHWFYAHSLRGTELIAQEGKSSS